MITQNIFVGVEDGKCQKIISGDTPATPTSQSKIGRRQVYTMASCCSHIILSNREAEIDDLSETKLSAFCRDKQPKQLYGFLYRFV